MFNASCTTVLAERTQSLEFMWSTKIQRHFYNITDRINKYSFLARSRIVQRALKTVKTKAQSALSSLSQHWTGRAVRAV